MEKGIIPMFHYDHSNDNLISIGTRGNWVRVSTGYSFQNSFANAKKVTDKLLKKKKIIINPNKSIKFLDKIFCYFILNYSNDSKKFFNVFLKNKFEDVVRFLVGDINFFKLIKIVFSLPKKKLFYSMFKLIQK